MIPEIIGAILLAIIALCALAICTPVRVSARFDSDQTPALRVKTAIFGGLVPVFTSSDAQEPAAARDEEPPEREEPRKPEKKKQKKKQNFVRYIPHMLRAAPRFISRTLSRVKFRVLEGRLVFGLADPADTGALYGVMTPFILFAKPAQEGRLSINPCFDGAALSGDGRFVVRFTPVALATPAFGFAWAAFASPWLSTAFR